MIYVINGVPERREAIEFEITQHGNVPSEQIYWISSQPQPNVILNQSRFSACRNWRDPYTGNLETSGGMSCTIGHITAWEHICASEREYGHIILEDDAKILAPLNYNQDDGLVYLGAKLMDKRPDYVDDEDMFVAPYVYWTVGYQITSSTARKLLESICETEMIPTDEFIPYHYGKNPNVFETYHRQKPSAGIQARCLKNFIVEPSGRWESATVNSTPAFMLTVFVFATDLEKASSTIQAYQELGYHIEVIGEDKNGWDTSGPSGAQKLIWLLEALNKIPMWKLRHMIILVSDGYDVLPLVSSDNLITRFEEMNTPILISGESHCWPNQDLKKNFPIPRQPQWGDSGDYIFPCSGLFMGFAKVILEQLTLCSTTELIDDQEILQIRIRSDGEGQWRVDEEAYLFQNLNRAQDDITIKENGTWFNHRTRCFPAILHANGPSSFEDFKPHAPELKYDKAMSVLEVADGILSIPFFSVEECARLVAETKESDSWAPLPGDNVPGDELRIKTHQAVMFASIEDELKKRLEGVIKQRWNPCVWKSVKDLFLIRYSRKAQPSIRLHEDQSYFSCSIVLKRACDGGDLYFPRQRYNDRLVEVGTLLVWPSRITHPHCVSPVKKGSRVSMVVWTKED